MQKSRTKKIGTAEVLPSPGKEIFLLRKELRLSQEEFAGEVGVARLAVSTWERRDHPSTPSHEGYVGLAKLALRRRRLDAALWFLEQIGLGRSELRSLVPEIDRSIKDFEKRLNVPAKGGEIIRVVPLRNPFERDDRPLPDLPFPAALIANRASVSYVVVKEKSLQPMFKPGDILVIDERETDVWNLQGLYVALFRHTKGLTRRSTRGLSDRDAHRYAGLARTDYPAPGLLAGWLRIQEGSETTYVLVEAPSVPAGRITSEVVAFEVNRPPTAQRARRRIQLPDLAVLGRVVAWISGEEKCS